MKLKLYLFGAIVLLLSLALFGCNKEDSKTTDNGIDTTAAAAKVNEANHQLELTLQSIFSGPEPEQPSDIDLSTPYGLYIQALEKDPNNKTANFGAAILEIVMISREARTNQLFTAWRDFGERDSIFEVAAPALFMRKPTTVQPALKFDALAMPLFPSLLMLNNPARIQELAVVDPTIADLQNFAATSFLPRISTAISRLEVVTQDTSFRFIVTATMQNDTRADPVILDLTEIYATLAGLNAIKAMFLMFTSYNLDPGGFTGAAMQSAMTRSSNFFALTSTGSSNMPAARTAWLTALDRLNTAIYRLEHETGNQSQHLLKIAEQDGVKRSELDSIKLYLPKVRTTFETSQLWNVKVHSGETHHFEDVRFSLNSVFTSPIQNIKTLFPMYDVVMDTVEYHRSTWIEDTVVATVSFNGQLYWNRSVTYRNGVASNQNSYQSMGVPAFDTYWNNKIALYRNKPQAELHMWCNAYFSASGSHTIKAQFEVDYYDIHYRTQPIITWADTSFATWHIPDPTMGGLLPGMTDSEMKRLMDMQASDWTRTMTMHFWDDEADSSSAR